MKYEKIMQYKKTILSVILLFGSVFIFGYVMIARQDFAILFLGELLDEYTFSNLPYNIHANLSRQETYMFYTNIGLLCFVGILSGMILFLTNLVKESN